MYKKPIKPTDCLSKYLKALLPASPGGYFAEGKIEVDEQYLVKRHVAPQATVLELGANLGVVSSVVNKMLTYPENQVVVEANPTIIPYLEANKKNKPLRISH